MINLEDMARKFSQVETLMTSLESSTMKELNKVFSTALTQLILNVEKTYPKYLKGNTLATIRATRMVKELAEYMVLFDPKYEKFIRDQLSSLIERAYAEGIDLGNFEMGVLEKGVANFDPSPIALGTKPMVEAAAFVVENSVNRLKNYSESFKTEASSLIAFNITLGISAKQTASQLRERFSIAQSKAVTIARTETIAALNEASTFVAKSNGLDAVQFFATADIDTCPYCLGRNQKIYRIDDIKVPLHPRCRCFLQPFMQDWIDEDDFYDAEWSKQYYETARNKRNVTNAPAPFEKIAGLKAPKAIWSPT